MLSAGLGAAGGANSALQGIAAQRAASTGNAGGYTAALDEAARQRGKTGAMAAEDIAAQNAKLKASQRQEGAAGLERLYGVDTSGMLEAMGQESRDVAAEAEASKTGWLQNMNDTIAALTGAARAYKPGGF